MCRVLVSDSIVTSHSVHHSMQIHRVCVLHAQPSSKLRHTLLVYSFLFDPLQHSPHSLSLTYSKLPYPFHPTPPYPSVPYLSYPALPFYTAILYPILSCPIPPYLFSPRFSTALYIRHSILQMCTNCTA